MLTNAQLIQIMIYYYEPNPDYGRDDGIFNEHMAHLARTILQLPEPQRPDAIERLRTTRTHYHSFGNDDLDIEMHAVDNFLYFYDYPEQWEQQLL